MRIGNRRATRDQLKHRGNVDLPDGVGGSVTGGPTEPIDLMRILAQGGNAASRGGAVSGAAHAVVSNLGIGGPRDPGIALSDGSRISFASIADAGILNEEEIRSPEVVGILANA